MRDLEASLAQRASAAAEADRKLLDVLVSAHESATVAAKRLDDIAAEIATAVAGQTDLGLDTRSGTTEFHKFLADKHRQILAILSAAREDGDAKAAILRTIGDQYSAAATPSAKTDPSPA